MIQRREERIVACMRNELCIDNCPFIALPPTRGPSKPQEQSQPKHRHKHTSGKLITHTHMSRRQTTVVHAVRKRPSTSSRRLQLMADAVSVCRSAGAQTCTVPQ